MLVNSFIVLGKWGNRWKVVRLIYNKYLINDSLKDKIIKLLSKEVENVLSFGLLEYLECLRENLFVCLELKFFIKVDNFGLIILELIGCLKFWIWFLVFDKIECGSLCFYFRILVRGVEIRDLKVEG